MSVVTVRAGLQAHDITRCLVQRRVQVQVDRVSSWYDYRCGQAHALVCDYEFASRPDTRNELLDRLSHARHAVGAGMLALVVWMTTTEPALDTLSWVNIQCGLQLRCSVVLCWTVEEMAQFLDTLSTTFVVSTEYSTRHAQTQAPLPVLIDALTQTPQILQRPDVVRLANRKRNIADVLSSHPDDFAGIPGLGAKRLARLHALLNVPFVSSQQRVDDVLRLDRMTSAHNVPVQPMHDRDGARTVPAVMAETERRDVAEGENRDVAGGVLDAVHQALQRVRDREDVEQ